jgi:hypothetical protein
MSQSETGMVLDYRWDDEDRPVATWAALQSLGFEPEDDYFGCPATSYDFGSFKLRAVRMMNLQMREVVSFSGIVSTPRTICSIEFDMPLQVESCEQCAAWIAWHLYENLPRNDKVIPRSKTHLIVFGLQHKVLLPWERARLLREREAEEYNLRPSCVVDRGLIKLGLKTLAKYIEPCANSDRITIWFDGQILLFEINEKRVILQAEGPVWQFHYAIPAGQLRIMPKRLLSEAVDVSIWRNRLQIERSWYDGIVEL